MTTIKTSKTASRRARTAVRFAKDVLGVSRNALVPPLGSELRGIAGDAGLPLLGHAVHIFRDMPGWAAQRYERYGPVSWMSAGGNRFVLLLGPDAAEAFFLNRDRALGNTEGWKLATGPFIARGLLTLEFDEHMQHRRIMQQAFTRSRLQGYLQAMNPQIAEAMKQWPEGDAVRLLPTIKDLSLDLAGGIFLGEDIGTDMSAITDAFQDMLRGCSAYVRYPVPGLAWSRGVAGRRALEYFMRSRLPAKRAGNGDDLFSALCHARSEDGETFTDDDVVSHMIFVLFAAHDTSTITMNTMCYQLAKHPEWQERARTESIALAKDHIDFDDLAKLETLDLVMKESLRMIVPICVTFRNTVKDTEILGHFVPKDTMVMMVPQFTHNMPEYWPDPERFDPDRFSPERREDKVHKYAWAPFGGGAHKCIGMFFGGMEIKAILHQMLLNFEWSVDPGYETKFTFSGTLPVPKDGLPVHLRRR